MRPAVAVELRDIQGAARAEGQLGGDRADVIELSVEASQRIRRATRPYLAGRLVKKRGAHASPGVVRDIEYGFIGTEPDAVRAPRRAQRIHNRRRDPMRRNIGHLHFGSGRASPENRVVAVSGDVHRSRNEILADSRCVLRIVMRNRHSSGHVEGSDGTVAVGHHQHVAVNGDAFRRAAAESLRMRPRPRTEACNPTGYETPRCYLSLKKVA